MWASRERMYGKASLERSSSLTASTMSRARGPHRPTQQVPDVRSSRWTEPSSGRLRRIQARSWRPTAPPVTTKKRSSASRVTVRSHMIPPRGASIAV